MKSKLFCFMTSLVITVFVTSCSKQVDEGKNNKDLIGNWQWVRTDGGFASQIHETPASTDKNIELKIDSSNRYYLFTNGALTSEGTYLLETRKCIHDHTNKTFVNFSLDTLSDFMVEKIDGQNLEVSDEAFDGLSSLYKRKIQNKD